MRTWPVVLSLFLALAAGASACAAPAISWRVENPFRFFTDPRWTEHHRRIYLALQAELGREPGIHEMERALEIESRGRGWVERLMALTHAADVAGAVHQEPCWYRLDGVCSGYVRPRRHMILAHLPSVSGPCRWFVNGTAAGDSPSCGDEVRLAVPYPDGARISVTAAGGEAAAGTVQVQDYLVVSMGDSFSSGEGNPDRAVRFDSRQAIAYDRNPAAPDPWLVGFPARRGAYDAIRNPRGWRLTSDPGFKREAANWLHRPCHRSLYSQHFMAALYLAVRGREQHHAVTFVYLGCTGAEIADGLFRPWTGNEAGERNGILTVETGQITGASKALCGRFPTRLTSQRVALLEPGGGKRLTWASPPLRECPPETARPIDVLLLSIGGNDIGFTGLLGNATLKPDALTAFLAALNQKNLHTSIPKARRLLRDLAHNFGELGKALRTVLHIAEPRRVFLSAYPFLAYAAPGMFCPAGKAGMERSFAFEFDPAMARKVAPVEKELMAVMRRAAAANGWTWVEEHRSLFGAHGFCAVGGAPDDIAAWRLEMPRRWEHQASTTFVALAETSALPGRREAVPPPGFAGEVRGGFGPGVRWEPEGYSPDRYLPYMPRARWVRTPNDAFLTTNLHEDNVDPGIAVLTRFMAYSGAFHPTAEGHAVMADALARKISALGLAGPAP